MELSIEQEPKNYELAYLLSSAVPEEDVLRHAGALTTLIEENGGIVKHVEEPKKRKLAYPVKKQGIAYFGWTTFRIVPTELATLEKRVKGETDILRYVMTQEEARRHASLLRPTSFASRAGFGRVPSPSREMERPEDKLDLEALDKKLEEILGK